MSVIAYTKRLKAGTLKFKVLPYKMKVAVIGHMKTDGLTVEAIGHITGLSTAMVYHYNRKHNEKLTHMIKANSAFHIGRFVARMESLYFSAKAKKDFRLCKDIEVDTITTLMKLDIIKAKPDAPNINVNINADSKIVEAELAEDVTLLERLKGRGLDLGGEEEIEDARIVGGDGTARDGGAEGIRETSSTNGEQGEEPDPPESAG